MVVPVTLPLVLLLSLSSGPPPSPSPSKQLSPRLQAVLSLAVRPDDDHHHDHHHHPASPDPPHRTAATTRIVADVGCDHAQLGLALLRNHPDKVRRVVAVDRCDEPLEVGRRNAEAMFGGKNHQQQLQQQLQQEEEEPQGIGAPPLPPLLSRDISFRRGEGLEPLCPSDGVDTVCIAGLGARSMVKILDARVAETNTDSRESNVDGDNNRDGGRGGRSGEHEEHEEEKELLLSALGVHRLVLQPVSARPHLLVPLRRWLAGNGFAIRDETFVRTGRGSGGEGRGRSYLNILALKSGDAGEEDVHALLFPLAVRTRVHKALRLLDDAEKDEEEEEEEEEEAVGTLGDVEGGGEEEERLPGEEELAAYREYVRLHAAWSESVRTDNYDAAAGFPQSLVSELYAAELALIGG